MSLTSDSFYVVLKSDDWNENYPNNNPINFRSKLLNQLNLDYNWEVALCDVQIHKPKKTSVSHSVWVYCDILVETQIGNRFEPLLRRVPVISTLTKLWVMGDIENLYYVKIKQRTFDSIGIVIKEDASKSSQLLSFTQEERVDQRVDWDPEKTTASTLTLHFRQIK